MSIVRGARATAELRKRLAEHEQIGDAKDLVADLPPSFDLRSEDNWLWDRREAPDPTVAPLRSEDAYALDRAGSPPLDLLHRTPYDVVYEPDSSVSTELKQQYCRRSVDLTMKGGTTSGVVYPLAICEIARSFRIRNVGGASAGAIGASAAAAAEIGRRAQALGTPLPGGGGDPKQGHVRRGFVGLADTVAWLAEVDAAPEQRAEYRLAQLFRPTKKSLSLYRIAVAVMRRNWFGIALLAGGILGWPSRIAAAVVTALALTVVAVVSAAPGSNWLGVLAPAAAGLAGLGLVIFGAVMGGLVVRKVVPKKDRTPEDLREPLPDPTTRRPTRITLPAVTAVGTLAIGVGLLWIPARCSDLVATHFWAALPVVFLALVVAIVAIHVLRIVFIVSNAQSGAFGLIAGSSDTSVVKGGFLGLWDKVAGMAKPTVDRALVPWLSETLSQLAGVDGVLRFGHLWCGAEWDGKMAPNHESIHNPGARNVNLELMTSELVQGVPYRFPLDMRDQVGKKNRPTLFVRESDLLEVFPDSVVRAIATGAAMEAQVIPTGDKIEDLYPFPDPWDLPVIFAVRLSMALPGLFQSVRAYRFVDHLDVRDDFGRLITRDGQQMMYPGDVKKSTKAITSSEKVSLEKTMWVEPLWFSDGGITSNFPIHFFDSPLPLWPTLGINLESHPRGFRHQDVWLSADWQTTRSPAKPLDKGFLSFAAAIVNTARGWRDTTQLFMPGYRGRIASVRQTKGEGGANLFMERETIAALALRGAFAGARLRRRFSSNAYWQRHQWLRMRVALENIDRLQREAKVALGQPVYSTLLTPGAQPPILAIDVATAGGDAALPERRNWFTAAKPARYWEAARALAEGLMELPDYSPDALSDRSPYPTPELRQVPPL
ncbi:hypothetical protein [Antrihabitans sp. YC2-6]|uniref:hypothetical protein n=1 Tax=Antrihabitans sp. YC2-6 TaxID=2799498 RepID=UPI0018F3406B|nr:hypothetical protein [Antrihabitans sp. YC2-6]MBJ8343451.1 hypothetical protein [Antrihabitans sp. YC2-6]